MFQVELSYSLIEIGKILTNCIQEKTTGCFDEMYSVNNSNSLNKTTLHTGWKSDIV
jgi:hypothetical protein